MLKKTVLGAILSLATLSAAVAASPLWLRQSAISPDGSTIVFVFHGDLFTVPVGGGRATQLTTNAAYDAYPSWSPDGTKIAFSSNRFGGFDVFVIPAAGGTSRRLTTHSEAEYVQAWLDNDHILYQSNLMPDVEDGVFPGGYSQVYVVSDKEGTRPKLFSSLTMENPSINKAGQILFQDYKGYEDPWRKHHTSPITRDVWETTVSGKRTYKKLSSFSGECRNPVWAPNGKEYYYLSEKSGSMNVYRAAADGSMGEQQITHFEKHPVRYLSVSTDGTLCFSYNGELYTLKPESEPRKLNIDIVSDETRRTDFASTLTNGAQGMAVAQNEKEIAFIAKGDVYVKAMEYATTRRITNTPEEERDVDISPDGSTLVYASERNGTWGLYTVSMPRKDDKLFTYAREIKETPLVVGKEACFKPKFSPDGKEVAFLANRTELRVINLATKAVRTVLPARFNFSYTDYDQWFEWSPDGLWFLTPYIGIGGWNNVDVALVKADGSKVVNLTESGYSDGSARWALGGKAMLFKSDRAGYRSHGSWGAQSDAYLMFFDEDAYDRFRMTKEERALIEEKEKAGKDEKKDTEKSEKARGKNSSKKSSKHSDKKAKKGGDTTSTEKVKPLVFDLDNRRDRIVRLTGNSSNLGSFYLSKDGRKLYYEAAFEGGYDLWVRDLDDRSTRILVKNIGGGNLIPDKSGNSLFVSDGTLRKLDLKSGNMKSLPFSAEYDRNPAEERAYIFEHVANLVRNKFYDKDYAGVDWDYYVKNYRRFLNDIDNNFDFAEMLSEMLGELNASHTGARYRPGYQGDRPTACLGAFFDEAFAGDGLLIKEIIKGSPLLSSRATLKAGQVILKIDGKLIEKDKDYYPLLSGKAGKRVVLTVTDKKGKNPVEVEVKPITLANQTNLLYKRWVEKRRVLTETYSKGEIGYVHVKAMDSESFRNTYSEVLGRNRNKKAIVVDIRHNGGGWLHNDLGILLSGKEFQRYVPRGQYIGSDPYSRWNKPSAVLVCEDDYSNAHGFPFMYKALGIGKLVGTPVAGTMTAVWWERQVDPSLVVGLPQVPARDEHGNYLENQTLQPDILIYQTPEQRLSDDDVQLRKAIDHLMTAGK